MTTPETFEKMLNEIIGLSKEDFDALKLGLSRNYFSKKKFDFKKGQVTQDVMEYLLIKTGYHKSIVESWEKTPVK